MTRRSGAASAIALLAYGAFLMTARCEPVQRFAFIDYRMYHFAAAALGDGASPYDLPTTAALAARDGATLPDGPGYVYPAWFAGALRPLTALPLRAAEAAWFLLSCAALLAATAAALRGRSGWWTAAVLAFPPTLVTLFVGQVNVLLLALVVAGWLLRERRPALAGVSLGAAAAVKLAPGLLLAALPLFGRWRTLAAGAVTLAGALALGEIWCPGSTRDLLRVAQVMASGTSVTAHPMNQSVTGFVYRTFSVNPWTVPWVDAHAAVRILAWALAAGLLALASFRMASLARRRLLPERRAWAALLCLVVVLSPLAWEGTFVLLLLALLLLLEDGASPRALGAAWLLIGIQRLQDPFAQRPQAFPVLVRIPPLTALALAGALLLLAVALRTPAARGRGERAGAETGTARPASPP